MIRSLKFYLRDFNKLRAVLLKESCLELNSPKENDGKYIKRVKVI